MWQSDKREEHAVGAFDEQSAIDEVDAVHQVMHEPDAGILGSVEWEGPVGVALEHDLFHFRMTGCGASTGWELLPRDIAHALEGRSWNRCCIHHVSGFTAER